MDIPTIFLLTLKNMSRKAHMPDKTFNFGKKIKISRRYVKNVEKKSNFPDVM